MTLHSAAVYFDEQGQPVGYVLGSDSRGECQNPETLETIAIVETEKAFVGENHIGLASGAFEVPSGNFETAIGDLAEVFKNIEEGIDYSHVDFLQRSSYRILIAKRSGDAVELFSVSNEGRQPGQENKVHSLHKIMKNSTATEENQRIWYSPCMQGYLVLKPSEPLHFDKAVDMLTKFLAGKDQIMQIIGREYDPGPTHLYKVGFDGIGKIGDQEVVRFARKMIQGAQSKF